MYPREPSTRINSHAGDHSYRVGFQSCDVPSGTQSWFAGKSPGNSSNNPWPCSMTLEGKLHPITTYSHDIPTAYRIWSSRVYPSSIRDQCCFIMVVEHLPTRMKIRNTPNWFRTYPKYPVQACHGFIWSFHPTIIILIHCYYIYILYAYI